MNLFILSYDIKDTTKTGGSYREQLFEFFLNHDISHLKGRVGSTVTFKSSENFDYWMKEIKSELEDDINFELVQAKPRIKTGFEHNFYTSVSHRKKFDEEWSEAKAKRKEEEKR